MPHRTLTIVHSTPGRVRLRLPWLHAHPEQAEGIAEALAALDGVEKVEVRALTGSVLCRYDPLRLDEARIARAVRASAGPGDSEVSERRRLARAARQGTAATHAAAALFKGLDADVLRATQGRLDLADAAVLGMLGVAVAKVATATTVSLPTWTDLLWYAYNVFSRQERQGIEQTPHPIATPGPPPR